MPIRFAFVAFLVTLVVASGVSTTAGSARPLRLEPYQAVAGCSPRANDLVREHGPDAVRGGCFLLRAITDSGTVHEVCAGAEDLAPLLAPFVDELLAEHRDARETRGAHVAFSLPAAAVRKPRAPPKRRCAQWIDLTDAGAGRYDDIATDAGF